MKLKHLGSALALSFLINSSALAFLDDKFEIEMAKEADAVRLARDTRSGDYELITVAELRKMIDDGRPMVLIDTMPFESSYQKEHIPGAKNFLFPILRMNVWDSKQTNGKTEADLATLLGNDRSVPVVFYCGFVNCTRSDNGALWARKLGYAKVYRVPGGLFAWKGAKYPVVEAK